MKVAAACPVVGLSRKGSGCLWLVTEGTAWCSLDPELAALDTVLCRERKPPAVVTEGLGWGRRHGSGVR